MITIELSKDDYAYDIQSLTKAFYPAEEIRIQGYSGILSAGMTLLVELEEDGISISLFENEKLVLKDSISDIFEDNTENPGKDHWRRMNPDLNSARRKHYKNMLKRLLYGILSQVSGRTLPWGTLTGVRPTKIPMEHIMLGDDPEWIRSYMKERYLCSSGKIELGISVAAREAAILEEIDYKNGYSLYVGIPFCPTTCLYCSFTSYSLEKHQEFVEDYLNALFKEIEAAAAFYPDKKLNTVYIGGGTPTTLSPLQLEQLIQKLRSHFSFTHVKEFTVEAGRPDSITMEKLVVLKKLGVTRISINPQTMNQPTLDLIGRKHSVEQVIEAFQMARKAGHDNINMDLIVGLPGETVEEVKHTLDEVGKLNPDSITVHSLVMKRAAMLNMRKADYEESMLPSLDEMLELGAAFAGKEGYEPYYMYRQKNTTGNAKSANQENIGYARYGKEGIYNILIMEEKQTILALGAGASSKFVFPEEGRVERIENVKSLRDYISRIDEMIHRKECFLEKEREKVQEENTMPDLFHPGLLDKEEIEDAIKEDLADAIEHGILVSNLAALLAEELGESEEFCQNIAMAGMLHDIGKLKLSRHLYGRRKDTLQIEEMKYVRMHATFSYDILKKEGFPEFILQAVFHHHENYDGSGYPDNLKGWAIPWAARIIRTCDVFAALVSQRPYRAAFDMDTAMELMIDEVKNFDMKVFLAFQRVVHSEKFSDIKQFVEQVNSVKPIGIRVFEKEAQEERI